MRLQSNQGIPRGILLSRVVSGAVALWAGWRSVYLGACGVMILSIFAMLALLPRMQVGNQSASIAEMPEASNRINTIFMTTFFVGGCLGTFLAGWGWHLMGWTGVCAVGFLMAASAFALTCLRWK